MNRREDVVEDEGYFIGEMDPFNRTVSVLDIVGLADEESDDRIVPLAASVVVLIEDKLVMFRMGKDTAIFVGARVDLNDKDVYVFVVDFIESACVAVEKVLSSMDPGDEIKLALEDNEAASPLMDTGSVLVLPGEDRRLEEI